MEKVQTYEQAIGKVIYYKPKDLMQKRIQRDHPFKLAYGSGEVEGNIAKEKICFDQL